MFLCLCMAHSGRKGTAKGGQLGTSFVYRLKLRAELIKKKKKRTGEKKTEMSACNRRQDKSKRITKTAKRGKKVNPLAYRSSLKTITAEGINLNVFFL